MRVQKCLVEVHLQKAEEYLWGWTGSKTTPGELAEFEAQFQEEVSSSAA
jgi:phenylpropionate dioxygenase-like ring-hydroxylating dioxygenase large terminal subunit